MAIQWISSMLVLATQSVLRYILTSSGVRKETSGVFLTLVSGSSSVTLVSLSLSLLSMIQNIFDPNQIKHIMNKLMLGTPTKAYPDHNPQFPQGIQELYTTIPEIQEINEKLKEDIPQVRKKLLLSIQKKKAGLLQVSQQPPVSRITNVENIPWRQVPRKNGAHRSVQPPNGDKVDINQASRPDQSLSNAQPTQMIPVYTLSNRQTDNLLIATRNEKQQSSQKSDLGVASSFGQQIASYQTQVNELIQEIHLLQSVNHSLELDGEMKSVKIIQLENQLSLKEKRISELVTREEELSKQLKFQIGRVDGKWACPNCGSLLLLVRQLEGEIQSYNRSHRIQIQRIAAMLRKRNMQIEQLYAKYSTWNFREFSGANQQRVVRIAGENQQTDHTIFVPPQQSDNKISLQGGSNQMIIHRAPPNTLHDVNRSQQTDVNRNQYIFLTNGNGNSKYSINHQQNQTSRESHGPQTLPSNSIIQPQTYKEVPKSPFPQQNMFQGQTQFSHPGNLSQTNSNGPIVKNYIIQSNEGPRNQISTPIGNPFRSPAQSPNHGQTQHIRRISNSYFPAQISQNFSNQFNVHIQQNRTSSEVIIPQPPKQLPHFQRNNMPGFQQIKMNPIPVPNQAQGNNLLSPARMSTRPVPRIQQPLHGEQIRHQSPQSQSQTLNQQGPSIPQVPISQGNQAVMLPQNNTVAPHAQSQNVVDSNFGTYIDVLGENNLQEAKRGEVRPSSIASREKNFGLSVNANISGNSQPQYRPQPSLQPEKTPEPQREVANIFEQNSSEITHTTYVRDPRSVNDFNNSIGVSSFDKKPFQPERSSGREKSECYECYEMKQKLRQIQEQSEAKIEQLSKKLAEVNFKSASARESLQTKELQNEEKITRLTLKIQQIQFNLRAAEEENITISKKLAQKYKSKVEATSSYGESEDMFKKMSQTRNENFQQRLKIQEFESKEAKRTYELKSLESRIRQLEAELTEQEDYYSKKVKETTEKARRQGGDLEQVSYKLNEKQAEIKNLRENMDRVVEDYERRERQVEQQQQAIKGLQKRELEYKKNLKSFAQNFDTYKKNLKEEYREHTEFLEKSKQSLEEQLLKEQQKSNKTHIMLQQRTVEYEQMLQKMQQAEIKVDTLEQLLAGKQQQLQRESEASHSNNAVNRAQINKANLEKLQQMSSRAEATQSEIYNLKQEIINIKLAKGSLETQLNSKDDQIKQLSYEISRLHIKLSSKEKNNLPLEEFEIDNAMEASYQTTSRKSEGKRTMMESTVYELTQERDMTKSKLAQIQSQVGVLNGENQTLRATIQSLHKNITELNKDAQYRASGKNKQIETVLQNQSQVRSLIELNQELNFKLKSLENECTKANQKNAANEARLSQNDSQIRSLKEENQELSFKVNSLQKKLAQINVSIANQQLSTGNTKLTQNQSQINQLMSENINLSYQVESLKKEIHQINSSQVSGEISNRLSQYQCQVQKLTEDNQLLQFQIESLQTQIHQKSSSNVPSEKISTKLAQYERQVNALTDQNKQLKSAIKIYQMDTSEFTETINTTLIKYESQVQKLTEENQQLQFSVESLQADLNKMRSSLANEEISAKMADYENQIVALMVQNKQLYSQVESLQRTFSNENEGRASPKYPLTNANLTEKDDEVQFLKRENQQLCLRLELLQRDANGESLIAQENSPGIGKLNEYESQIKDLIEANHQLKLAVGSFQRNIEIENQKQAHPTANLAQQESLIWSLRQQIISLRSQIDLLQRNRTAVQGSTFVQQSAGETGYSPQKEVQLQSLLQANETLNSKVEQLSRQIDLLGGINASQQNLKVDSINEQFQAFSSKITEYEKAYNALGEKNNTANLKITELNSTIAIFSEENEKMYGKYHELNQFKSTLEGRLNEYQVEVRRLDILNGQLNFRISEMEKQSSLGSLAQTAKFANKTSVQQEIRKLSEENRAANLSIAQFEQAMREKNRHIKQFEEQMTVVNQQLTQTLKNNQDVTAMMQSLEVERQSLANTLAQFENQKTEQLRQLSLQYEQFIEEERAALAKSLNLSGEVNVVDLIRNYEQQLLEVCNERNKVFNNLCLAEEYIVGLQDRLNSPPNNTANNPTEESRKPVNHEAIDPIEQIKGEVQNTVSKIQWEVVQESPKKGGQSSLQPNNSELLEQVRNVQDQVLYLKLKLNEEAMRSLQFEQQYQQVSKAYLLLIDEMRGTISAKNQIEEVPIISSKNISASQILFDAQALKQGHEAHPYRNTPELIIDSRNSLVMGSGNRSETQILMEDSRLLRTENNMYITTIARLEAELSSVKLNYTQALEDIAKRDKLIQAKLVAEKRYQSEIYEANKKAQQQSFQSSLALSQNFAPEEQKHAQQHKQYESRINQLKRERDSLALAITTQNESTKQQIEIEVQNSLKHYVPQEQLAAAEEYIERLLHETTEKDEQFKAMVSEFNKERTYWEGNGQLAQYLNRIADLQGIITQERQQFTDLSHDYQIREEIIHQLNDELASRRQTWERVQNQFGETNIQITTVDQTHQDTNQDLEKQLAEYQRQREILLYQSKQKDASINNLIRELEAQKTELSSKLNSPRSSRSPREGLPENHAQYLESLKRQIAEYEREKQAILGESSEKDEQIRAFSEKLKAQITAFEREREIILQESLEKDRRIKQFSEGLRVKISEFDGQREAILNQSMQKDKQIQLFAKNLRRQIEEFERQRQAILEESLQKDKQIQEYSQRINAHFDQEEQILSHHSAEALRLLENRLAESQQEKQHILATHVPYEKLVEAEHKVQSYIAQIQELERSNNQIQSLQVQIQQLQKGRSDDQEMYDQHWKELEAHYTQAQEAQNNKFQARLLELQNSRNLAQNNYTQLKRDTDTDTDIYIQNQKAERSQNEVQRLQVQIQELQKNRNQTQNLYAQVKQDLQDNSIRLQIAEIARKDIQNIQAQLYEAEKGKFEAQNMYEQLRKETESYISQIEEKCFKDIQQLQAQIHELEISRNEVQNMHIQLKSESEAYISQIQERSRNERASLQTYIATLEQRENQAKSLTTNSKLEAFTQAKETEKMENEVQSLRAFIQELEQRIQQNQNLYAQHSREAENRFSQIQETEKNQYEARIHELEQERIQVQSLLAHLKQELDNYAAQIQRLRAIQGQNQNKEAHLKGEVANYVAQLQASQDEVNSLQGKILKLEMGISEEKDRHIKDLNEEIQITAFHKKTHASQKIIPDSELIETLQQQIEASKREKEEIAVMLTKQREQFGDLLQAEIQKKLEDYTPKQKMLQAEGYITVVTDEVHRITGYAQSLEAEIGRLNFELEAINQEYGKVNKVLIQLERHQAILIKEKESNGQEIKSLNESLNLITRENEQARVNVRQFEEMKLKATKQNSALLQANQSLEQTSLEAVKHSQLAQSRLREQNTQWDIQRQQYQQRLSMDSQQINSLLQGIQQLEQEKAIIFNQKLASDEQLRVTVDQLKNSAAETQRTLNKVKELEQKQLKSTAENFHILGQVEAQAQQSLVSVLNLEKAKTQRSEEQITSLTTQLNAVATERASLLKKMKELQERFLKSSAENEASLQESIKLQEKKGEAAKQQELNTMKQQYENELLNCNRQITYLTQAIQQLEQQKVALIQEKKVHEEQVKMLTQKLVFATTESDNSLKKIKEIEERNNRTVAQNQAILQKTKDIEEKSYEKLKQSELAMQRVKEYEEQIKIASLEGENSLKRLKEIEERKTLSREKQAALERRIKELEDQKLMSEVELQASLKRANGLEEAIKQVKSEQKLEKQAIAEELANSKAEMENMSKYIAESEAHMSEILNESIEKDMQIQEFTDELKTQVAELKVQRETMTLEILQKQSIIEKLENIVNSNRAQFGQREEAYRASFLQKDARIVELQNDLKKFLIKFQEEKEASALLHIQNDFNESLPKVDLQVMMDQYAPKSKLLEAEQYIETVVQELKRLTGYAGQLEQEREFKNAEMLTMKESLEYQLLQALQQLKVTMKRVNELQKALAECKIREEQSLLDRRIIESSQGTQGDDRSKDIIHERAGSKTEDLILGGLIEGMPMIDMKMESQLDESQREYIRQLKRVLVRLQQENEALRLDSEIAREKLTQLSGQEENEQIAQLKAQVGILLQERNALLINSEERDRHIETVLQQAFQSSPFLRNQDEVDEREKLSPLKQLKPESIGQIGETSRFLAENFQTTTKQLNPSEEAHFFQGKEVSIIKPKKVHDLPLEIQVANEELQNIDSSFEQSLDVKAKAYINQLKNEIYRLQQSPRNQKIKPRSNPHALAINISHNSHNDEKSSGSSRIRKDNLLRHPSPQQINESHFLKGKLMDEEKQLFKYISSRDRKGEVPTYRSELHNKDDYDGYEALLDSPRQLLAQIRSLEGRLQDAEIRISTLQAELETSKIDFETERINFDSYRVEMEDRMRVLQSQRQNLEENANISEELQQIAEAKLSDVAQKREIEVALLSQQIKLIGKDNTGQMELIEHQFNQKSEMERKEMQDKLQKLQRENQELLKNLNTKIEEVAKKDLEITVLAIEVHEKEGIIATQERDRNIQAAIITEMETKIADFQGVAAILQQKTAEYQLERQSKNKQQSAEIDEVAGLNDSLSSVKGDLFKKQASLSAAEKALAEANAKLPSLEQELARKQAKLIQKDEKLMLAANLYSTEQAKWQIARREMEKRIDESVALSEKSLQEKERELARLQERNEGLQVEATEYRAMLLESQAELNNARAKLLEVETLLAPLGPISEVAALMAGQQQKIAELQIQNQEAKSNLAELEGQLFEASNRLIKLQTKSVEAESRSIEARNELIGAETELLEAEKKIAQMEAYINIADQALDEKDGRILELEGGKLNIHSVGPQHISIAIHGESTPIRVKSNQVESPAEGQNMEYFRLKLADAEEHLANLQVEKLRFERLYNNIVIKFNRTNAEFAILIDNLRDSEIQKKEAVSQLNRIMEENQLSENQADGQLGIQTKNSIHEVKEMGEKEAGEMRQKEGRFESDSDQPNLIHSGNYEQQLQNQSGTRRQNEQEAGEAALQRMQVQIKTLQDQVRQYRASSGLKSSDVLSPKSKLQEGPLYPSEGDIENEVRPVTSEQRHSKTSEQFEAGKGLKGDDMEQLKEYLARANSKIAQLEQERLQFEGQISKLQKREQQLLTLKENYETDLKQSSERQEEVESHLIEIESCNLELEKELEKIKDEKRGLIEQLEEVKQAHDALVTQIATIQREFQENKMVDTLRLSEEGQSQLEMKDKKIEQLSTKNLLLEKHLKTVQAEMESWRMGDRSEVVDQTEIRLIEAQSQIKKLETAAANYQLINNQLKSQNDLLKKSVEQSSLMFSLRRDDSLLLSHDQDEKGLLGSPERVKQSFEDSFSRAKGKQIATIPEEKDYLSSEQKQSHTGDMLQYESLRETIAKIISKLNNFENQVQLSPALLSELDDFVQLKDLLTSLTMRLRSTSAAEASKTLKVALLEREISEAKESQQTLKQREVNLQKYLKEYQELNKELKAEQQRVVREFERTKAQLQDFEGKVNESMSTPANSTIQQNAELKQKLVNAEQEIEKIRNSSLLEQSINPSIESKGQKRFLRMCLEEIDVLEAKIAELDARLEMIEGSKSQTGGDKEKVLSDLQELEERLIENGNRMMCHQEITENELIQLLREHLNCESIKSVDKIKIEEYLALLEQQIIMSNQLHEEELQNYRKNYELINEELQQFKQFTRQPEDPALLNKCHLVEQISALTLEIEKYHREANFRQRKYHENMVGLNQELETIKKQYEGVIEGRGEQKESEQIVILRTQIQNAMERAIRAIQQEPLISSSSVVQVAFAHTNRLSQSEADVQTEPNGKAFLEYVLDSRNLDREDVLLLKRRIAQMQERNVKANISFLKQHENKLEKLLLLKSESQAEEDFEKQKHNIMTTLANNLSHEQISAIFELEDTDEVLNRLNEALILEMDEPHFKQISRVQIAETIDYCKRKYYTSETKLSEQMTSQLLSVMTARQEAQFLSSIEQIFRSLFNTEENFRQVMKSKDELYMQHKERMNEILNPNESNYLDESMEDLEEDKEPDSASKSNSE